MRAGKDLRAGLIAGVIVVAALAVAAVVMARQDRPIQTGVDVLSRMHGRHEWTQGCIVLETSAAFRSGRVDRWYETACPTGQRRVDLLPADSLNGLLFRHDSLYDIRSGQVDTAQALVHALSILMYDAASAPPDETADRLRSAGFDFTTLRTSQWQDRAVYVVGGHSEDDRNSTQFWIDIERLVPVRIVESYPVKGASPADPPLVREVWLENYTLSGDRWLPGQLSFFRNGERFLVEKMSILATGLTVDSTAFLPDPWLPPSWTATQPLTSRN